MKKSVFCTTSAFVVLLAGLGLLVWAFNRATVSNRAAAAARVAAEEYRAQAEKFEARYGIKPDASLPAKDLLMAVKKVHEGEMAAQKKAAAEAASKAQNGEVKDARLKLAKIENYGENGVITIYFEDTVQTDEIADYIRIDPAVSNLTISVRHQDWWDEGKTRICLESAAIPYDRDITVTVLKKLPFKESVALKSDKTLTLRRPNRSVRLSFADSGRYLAPRGPREICLEAVNVTGIVCSAWRVRPENVVQMMAREESKYAHYHCWYEKETLYTELSDEKKEWFVPVASVTNRTLQKKVSLLPAGVRPEAQGIFYLKFKADKAVCERLVTVTDLGLSVRASKGSLAAWVTSLTTGAPVAGATVSAYALNGRLLASAVSSALGEAKLDYDAAREEPFAMTVVSAAGDDETFMALTDRQLKDETLSGSARGQFLGRGEVEAFVWTERGIYRPEESIFVQILARNAQQQAPTPFPVRIDWVRPDGRVFRSKTGLTDARGSYVDDSFSVPASQPCGKWQVRASMPGEKGRVIGSRDIQIEEFVPPHVRVKIVDLPNVSMRTNLMPLTVSVEQLYGGPAAELMTELFVMGKPLSFTPAGWENFTFCGHCEGIDLTRLGEKMTDASGRATYDLDPDAFGVNCPVKLTFQASATEANARAAYARDSLIYHYHDYYVGSDVPSNIRASEANRRFKVATVRPDGSPDSASHTISVTLSRIENIYSLESRGDSYVWKNEEVRQPVSLSLTQVQTDASGCAEIMLPCATTGEYELELLSDNCAGYYHSRRFWVSSAASDELNTNLTNPSEIELALDRPLYRVGEVPELTIKSPITGTAYLQVMKEDLRATRVIALTNRTQTITLDPVVAADAPNLDLALSVVQSVVDSKALAPRATGRALVRVKPASAELAVRLNTKVSRTPTHAQAVTVTVSATGESVSNAVAVVTLVDEAIHLLTGETAPNPSGVFYAPRRSTAAFYDIYSQLFPVYGEEANARAKTGGGLPADLMNRVSPLTSRRFEPLSRWQAAVPLTNGVGSTSFVLPHFNGEVRVTALVYSDRATGVAWVHEKVADQLVMEADAPRFLAPGDRFLASLSLANRSAAADEIAWRVAASSGTFSLAAGASTNLLVTLLAPAEPGEHAISFAASGCGETHETTLHLPVRPAVAWIEKTESRLVGPNEKWILNTPTNDLAAGTTPRQTLSLASSPMGELKAALDYLARYPYGCLEQTTSQMMPLVTGASLLSDLTNGAAAKWTNTRLVVEAGLQRVLSMWRSYTFVMWPDSDQPASREYNLYAAHFVVEAKAAGYAVNETVYQQILSKVESCCHPHEDANTSAYAAFILALANKPPRAELLTLWDVRDELSLAARAEVAIAFARLGEGARARRLLADAALRPESVTDAAFAIRALQEMDASDMRIEDLVSYLLARRDKMFGSWYTTTENSRALQALAIRFSARAAAACESGRPVLQVTSSGEEKSLAAGESYAVSDKTLTIENTGSGMAWATVRTATLPILSSVTNVFQGLQIERRFCDPEGHPIDWTQVKRGDLIVVCVDVQVKANMISDLVIQDLFPAGLEHDSLDVSKLKFEGAQWDGEWILHSEVRDDRVLVFANLLGKDDSRRYLYPLRAVSAGDFVYPGLSAEAMYDPFIRASTSPCKIHIEP